MLGNRYLGRKVTTGGSPIFTFPTQNRTAFASGDSNIVAFHFIDRNEIMEEVTLNEIIAVWELLVDPEAASNDGLLQVIVVVNP